MPVEISIFKPIENFEPKKNILALASLGLNINPGLSGTVFPERNSIDLSTKIDAGKISLDVLSQQDRGSKRLTYRRYSRGRRRRKTKICRRPDHITRGCQCAAEMSGLSPV